MADSRLTVRTLALAMVALVLACVHAARGDGRGAGIATFSSGSRAGSAVAGRSASSSRTGSITTVRGDPWKAAPDHRPSGGRQVSTPNARVSAKPRPSGKAGPKEAPICIVRRPGQAAPIVPLPPRPEQKPAAMLPDPGMTRVMSNGRNAFALSASMVAGVK